MLYEHHEGKRHSESITATNRQQLAEVSSPGMDRILFCENHYARYVGERVELKLLKMFDGQKNYEGLLKGTEDDCVVIEVKDEEYLFPIEDIGKIRVIPIFE